MEITAFLVALCVLSQGCSPTLFFSVFFTTLKNIDMSQSPRSSISASEVEPERGEQPRGEEGAERGTSPEDVAVNAPRHGADPTEEEEQERDRAEAERKLEKATWTNVEHIMRRYCTAYGRRVPIENLALDVNQTHGQTRPIDTEQVRKLVESFTLRAPSHPIRMTGWESNVDRKIYVISGQHQLQALMNLRLHREQRGLSLPEWLRVAEIDVLRYDTPLIDRKTVAGAANSSARVARATTLTECVRNYQALEENADMDFPRRVVKAIEVSGLNPPGATPVCLRSMCNVDYVFVALIVIWW